MKATKEEVLEEIFNNDPQGILDEPKWKCTDPDMNQWGRKTGDKLYEFKQDMKYPDGSVIKEEEEINLNEYTEKEINDHLAPFGWSIDILRKENSPEGAEWLMAECIFEQIAI